MLCSRIMEGFSSVVIWHVTNYRLSPTKRHQNCASLGCTFGATNWIMLPTAAHVLRDIFAESCVKIM